MNAGTVRRRWARRGFSITDLIGWLLILLLLVAILLPSLSRAREQAKRAVCAANLLGIGQGEHIYSNGNMEWFPQHFYAPQYSGAQAQPQRSGVRFVGTMGSNSRGADISEETTSTAHSRESHPSRSMFLLVIDGLSTTKQFICPSSGDDMDDLRNRGSDHQGFGRVGASQPGLNRFDFRGYLFMSYGYQLPYGRRGKPREALWPGMPINADKGPYYMAGRTDADTGTTADARNAGAEPPRGAGFDSLPELLRLSTQQWRAYNSANHNGAGQNVLFVDSHVEFVKRPIVGVNNDNIYTVATKFSDPLSFLSGMVPAEDEAPLTNTDSCIVP